MNWNYLMLVLLALGFSIDWRDMIHHCLSSVTYSIHLNGYPFGNFASTSGLCQGDPLLSYLFILAMEGHLKCYIRLRSMVFLMVSNLLDMLLRYLASYLLLIYLFFEKPILLKLILLWIFWESLKWYPGKRLIFQNLLLFSHLDYKELLFRQSKMKCLSPSSLYLGAPNLSWTSNGLKFPIS